jgi:homoserine O-succinyltransferase
MTEHQTKNTAEPSTWRRSTARSRGPRTEKFDGLIITGAPIEHLPFEEVTYWDELTEVIDWTQTNVHSTFGVCWGGMAMLYHFHGVQKAHAARQGLRLLPAPQPCPASPYLRGFSDDCVIPVSRWTEMRQAEIDAAGPDPLLGSAETGPCLVEDPAHRALYIFNHFEYDSDTLKRNTTATSPPARRSTCRCNYYPDDDPARTPQNRWRSHAHLLYGNWINEIYHDHALRHRPDRAPRAITRDMTFALAPSGRPLPRDRARPARPGL